MRRLVTALLLLVSPAAALAQRRPGPPPAPPAVYATPAAAAPGRTTEVTFHGANGADFGDAAGVWTSFAADAVRSAAGGQGERDSPSVTYRLTVPADVPVGIGAVRVATAGGVSSLVPFMIDDLPSVAEARTNTTARDAQPIPFPAAVDGNTEPLSSRYFKLTATKGQRVSAEVVAQRLGSKLDPMIRLLDLSGRELAYCDDAPGIGSDCRFRHTFDADGDYLLELRDANYEGGADYRYRLRVGDFPLAVAPFPVGGRRGETVRFAVEGPDCSAVGPIAVALPRDAPRAWVGVKYPGGQGSAFVPVLAGDREETIESEPNDVAKEATRVTLPASISGRMDRPGDRDYYCFEAKQGDHLSFRGRTRGVGAPGELFLRLLKPDGSQVAASRTADPKSPITAPGPDEPVIEAIIPADGAYYLAAEELARGGGPGMVYRIEAEPVRPGFSLSVEADKVEGPAGGTVTLKVTCVRRDYGGPITLSVRGVEGLAVENNVIKPGANDTDLKVRLPTEPPPRLVNFTIVGDAKVGGEDVVQTVSTVPAMKKLFPRMMFMPPELDGLIGLGVRESK